MNIRPIYLESQFYFKGIIASQAKILYALSPKSLPLNQLFINSVVQRLFSDVVKHHVDNKHNANNTRVSKTDMAFAYLELIVWWGRGHKSDTHTTVISVSNECYEGEVWGWGYEGIEQKKLISCGV